MFGLGLPLYPSDETLAMLSGQRDVQTWSLDESFQPRLVSKSLREPLPCLTPELKIRGRQWLIQATVSARASLQSGLLRLGQQCLYESNPSNTSSHIRRWKRAGALPPGWWHRKRDLQLHHQPLLLLTTHNNPNYYHWLTQPGFSPLFLQEHFGLTPLLGASLAVSYRPRGSLPAFIPSLLQALVPEMPVVYGVALASTSLCRFSVQQHFTDVVVSPSQLLWLKRRCFTQLPSVEKPWRRVLISRRNSSRRRCLNEDQLFSALVPYGFERVCLEGLSALEQMRLFSESALLVGPHGAGFSNLIACSPNASVVEFMPRSGSFSHYYAMADVLGLNHGHLMATRCDLETDDFTVDPADLIDLLQEMQLL